MMIYEVCNGVPEEYQDDVRQLINECSSDFVPPLLKRTSTKDCCLDKEQKESQLYVDELIKQNVVLALGDEGTIAGLLSYEEKRWEKHFGDIVSTYVTTVCVAKKCRGKGIGRMLYYKLFERYAEIGPVSFTTRTWSTNRQSVELLVKLGFALVRRIKNDRGNGIHTFYYHK